jgi:hypothetical protein
MLRSTFCFSDSEVRDALGFFGSKGPFMPVVFYHRGLWYVNLSVLAVGSFVVSYLNRCLHIILLLFDFAPLRGYDVSVFALVFYLLGLALKPLVVGIKCFIFNCYIPMWLTQSDWCPPVCLYYLLFYV